MTTFLAESREMSKRFGSNLAVDRVGLVVSPGEIVGLIGANGAGKTTFIRMLLGLLTPDEGHVRLFGSAPSRATRRRIGYLPQTLGLYEDLTVGENLSFTARVFGTEVPSLGDLGPVGDTLVADLPLGLKRRAGFHAALSHHPDLLVLDEPTSGVGPLGRADLWETIHASAEQGAGVLVTTHYMDEAEQCDRLLFLASGREIASGTIEQILSGQSAIEVTSTDRAAAMSALESAGLPVLPAGDRLRVPGSSPDLVRSVLGRDAGVRVVEASLEEAFVNLVGAN